MSYCDILPTKLQDYIQWTVYAQICQKIWRGRSDCNRYAVNIARKYTGWWLSEGTKVKMDGGKLRVMDLLNPSTAVEIEYCLKHGLQQGDELDFWPVGDGWLWLGQKLSLEVEGGRWRVIDPLNPSTAVEIEYCVKHGSQRSNWEDFIQAIYLGLWQDEYVKGGNIKFYNRTAEAYQRLKERFVKETE